MLRSLLRKISRLIAFGVLVTLALVGAAVWYASQPVTLAQPKVDFSVEHGRSMREVAHAVARQGVGVSPFVLSWMARVTGHAHRIQAGEYRVETGITPWQLIELLSEGSNNYAQLAVIEGWHWRRLRAALDAMPDLRHDTLGRSDTEVAQMLGIDGALEGRFFPDTYFFARGSSDVELLKRAADRMQQVLAEEWAARDPAIGLANAEDALILASVVEKETGLDADRGNIASVFHNRLRIGMPLQSDPTVIYGMGTDFDGNLRRRDLQADTPYNTYTRRGLPPSPLAMVGRAALRATLRPPRTDYLYFVARGNGASVFSRNLDDHNRAVARYQKGGAR
ncbi:endolytic transglycosylase MltG [Uliginosibacterium sp. H1]|uniref:endolytic transglycosylase MltG n=1 Tax=Uliginosibacterium sp. H1 TaxID=3114757 RepID=UPI002E185F53|nr:endolytic transglycosylase MltG [Uliginosibacterium sp. H1]